MRCALCVCVRARMDGFHIIIAFLGKITSTRKRIKKQQRVRGRL